MAWLFERIVELAAWVALVLGLVFLAGAVYYFVHGVLAWMNESRLESTDLLIQSAIAASAFVLSIVAMGVLACIDHYVFDADERIAAK
ncbi:hypothetical protein [Lacipirellula limnantheis]|uniref:Uncharacterized protein n=1 Tax=Lacipirellula limnantheis TaxID=2528024 RepID=A0A517TRD6_9BACT|nr:hypothetical protein [Lacipirellula limnantheis]QDT70929.1 hypothetical protein I41_00820 [Lacipirellula limnantheis]